VVDIERGGAISVGLLGPDASLTRVVWSFAKVPGDLSVGLLAVRGILSSLLRSSFFSKEANSGRVSAPPLAPLTIGTVGCRVLEVTGAVTC
jgi:hypothetical protein